MTYDEATLELGQAIYNAVLADNETPMSELTEFLDFLDNFPGLAEAWDARQTWDGQ